MSSVNPDRDLNGAFRDHWAKLLPFTFRVSFHAPGKIKHISCLKKKCLHSQICIVVSLNKCNRNIGQ